jgi:hypothetical protein
LASSNSVLKKRLQFNKEISDVLSPFAQQPHDQENLVIEREMRRRASAKFDQPPCLFNRRLWRKLLVANWEQTESQVYQLR